jgi:hypothetical protein
MLQSSNKIDSQDDLKVGPSTPTCDLIYRSAADLNRLSDLVQPLIRGRETLDPRFYLGSISTSAWIPRVVVITRDEAIVGVVHAKERKIAGIPTGMIYIDTVLDNILFDDSTSAEPVVEKTINRLLADPEVRGIRLCIRAGGAEHRAIQGVAASRLFDVNFTKIEHHRVLRVPSTFEVFLQKLGPRTRRNFRYYRRRFAAAGGQYVEAMAFADFRRAAFQLVTKDVVGADTDGLNRALNILAAVKWPLLTGLRIDGEYVGILVGWYESDQATVFFQLNDDRDRSRMSLSVVLRAYLIESLIGKDIRTLRFWGGVEGPLARYTESIPTICAYVDAPGFWWRTIRRIVRRTNSLLPASMAEISVWIAPRKTYNPSQNVL